MNRYSFILPRPPEKPVSYGRFSKGDRVTMNRHGIWCDKRRATCTILYQLKGPYLQGKKWFKVDFDCCGEGDVCEDDLKAKKHL